MPNASLVSALAAGCLVVACGDGERAATAHPPVERSPRHAKALGLTRRLPAAYRRVCQRQARDAPTGAEMCPPLIPTGSLTVLYRGRSLGRDSAGGGYSADLASHSLNHLGGRRIDTNGGHWRYDVAWAPSVRRAVVGFVERPHRADDPSSCRRTRVAASRMEACRVVPHERGGGLNGGHIAYIWNHAGVTYVISLHGYANEPRARAMVAALATQVTARP